MIALFRSLALTLALGGMLARALLPAGWMPNLQGQGSAVLVICTMDGMHRDAPPPRDQGHHQADDRNNVCPFAAAAHLAPPQLSVAFSTPVFVVFAAPATVAQLSASEIHNPAHAPRGPPISV